MACITVLIAAGFINVKAQAFQERDLPWTGYLWAGCANGGQGELLYGTLHQHTVFQLDEAGNLKNAHFNYHHTSEFKGLESNEIFKVYGASNMGPDNQSPFIFVETLQLRGDMGTKVVIKTKWQLTQDGEFVMELFFEKCN